MSPSRRILGVLIFLLGQTAFGCPNDNTYGRIKTKSDFVTSKNSKTVRIKEVDDNEPKEMTPSGVTVIQRSSNTDFPTLMWYTFSKDTIVEKVEIKPKRNTEVDKAQWQVITIDGCDPDSSSWIELKSGKMASRPVPGQYFVAQKMKYTEAIRCLGVAFSDDKWLDKITILGKPGVECYHSADGTDYRGSKAETQDGHQCIAWDQSLSTENNPKARPEAGLILNYCRNPDQDANGPWCYTIQGNGAYGYCDIQRCAGEM